MDAYLTPPSEKTLTKPLKYTLGGDNDAPIVSVAERDLQTRLLQMQETTGMASPLAGDLLLRQAFLTQPEQGVGNLSQGVEALNRQAELMHAIGPQNGLEGLLVSQMLATHNMGMAFAHKAMSAKDNKIIDANINRATKLQRTFVAQVEALSRLRRGGQQTIQVQHVHVNKGGQAVIGQQG